MSLYTLKEICLLARSKGFAVPAFNCYNFETVTWAVEAAEEEKSPVIIMIYPGFEKVMPLEYFTSVARLAAQRADVPVAVSYTHLPASVPAVAKKDIPCPALRCK